MASEWLYAFKLAVSGVALAGFTAFITPLKVDQIELWREQNEARLELANDCILRRGGQPQPVPVDE